MDEGGIQPVQFRLVKARRGAAESCKVEMGGQLRAQWYSCACSGMKKRRILRTTIRMC